MVKILMKKSMKFNGSASKRIIIFTHYELGYGRRRLPSSVVRFGLKTDRPDYT